ncbi:TIGR03564 family F420-dependent LLM class oxidoreductase [Pseudonocardia yuanmonensis]|uniref:TIGR03564 family F420-dependent LLM class oxidoreductase n=1 Tax=Pseudonocardia yuanmonensis TaxID=1095914 RepID=A0ABP8XAM0_9PSEU
MAMRISMFGYLGDGGGRSVVDAYVEELARLRDEGFRRYWTAQLPYEPDLLTVLAVALREVPGIEVGTGVVPIQPQHPMALAQRALTVNLIGEGRLTLGLGLSHRPVVEGVWGLPFDRPVRRLAEYLDGLLPLLAGEKAAATGELVTTRGSLRVPGAPAPEVYVAALGPQMLRLAGRRTAGTVTWMTGPRTLAEHVVPTIRGAAEEAGRTVRVVASLPVAVTDDVDAARAEAARQFAVYGRLPSYRAMLDREGYAGPEDAAIVGGEQEVAERLGELREAGVDEYVALPFSPDPDERARTRALLRAQDGE